MKKIAILTAILIVPFLANSQDLELDVHVLPTSVLGDPVAFNITVKNKGDEEVTGVEAKLTLKSGISFTNIVPKDLDFDPKTGVWKVGTVDKYRAKIMTVMAKYVAREDAILLAEISASQLPDPDSTPGNGIDTNGNGKTVNDKGDEDDGDAAQIGPFN
ncbi:MAG: hypothetical protein AB3N14_10020 [Flavobacteriaceae bacterium]